MLILFPIPIKAKYFVSVYILWELYRGFSMSHGDNVAHFAHLGGALFGYIMIKVWSKNKNQFY
jgi:membrane associated rhomboid family serine protease